MNSVESNIRIGISSCLLGNRVRYDCGHQYDHFITETLGKSVTFIPICPELECGLGVPRETMQLVGEQDNFHLLTTKTGLDHTARLLSWAVQKLQELQNQNLHGFIFKSRSPSCGISGVKVLDEKDGIKKIGIGLFAGIVMENLPLLPVIDEESFHDFSLREEFIARVFRTEQED